MDKHPDNPLCPGLRVFLQGLEAFLPTHRVGEFFDLPWVKNPWKPLKRWTDPVMNEEYLDVAVACGKAGRPA